MNFKNYGNEPPADNGGASGRTPGNFPLARQTSIYSLTFDEFQNTMGGIGKDFGSMNMDELLKNIWSAEETQTMATSNANAQCLGVNNSGGYLQRQGSLTLPRTLSQKTVDEVWKDISKEYDLGKDGNNGAGGSNKTNMPQRQQTLGEMTLEEFLVRAGVVREDTQLTENQNNGGFFGNSTGLGIVFQQQTGQNQELMGNRVSESNNHVQSSNLQLNVNGVRLTQQQQSQQPQIFPKRPNVTYGSHLPLANNTQLGSPGIRGGVMVLGDQGLNSNLIPGSVLPGGGMGLAGLGGAGAVSVATGAPANQLSADGIGKSNGNTSSVSPVPCVFNGGLRGRKCSGAVEKVVERRQRRMIKNRESAARSRARKQAYTMELEAEVAKLKEENEELRKKQEEIMEMQKNQAQEMMDMQRGAKKRCLRRTQSGPW